MKSENKLNDVILKLRQIQKSDSQTETNELSTSALATIQEFIVDNSCNSPKKYNLYNYTSKEEHREILKGVCYDTVNKCAVATDAHILIIDRAKYDQAVVDKYTDHLDKNGCVCVDKYGNLINGVFPKYYTVLPSDEKFEQSEKFYIPASDVDEYIKKAKAYIKTHGVNEYNILYKINDTFFDAKFLLSFLIATDGNVALYMKECHDGELQGIAIWYDDEKQCLLMPVAIKEKDLSQCRKTIGQECGLHLALKGM